MQGEVNLTKNTAIVSTLMFKHRLGAQDVILHLDYLSKLENIDDYGSWRLPHAGLVRFVEGSRFRNRIEIC
ncbi:hypothetical protein HDG40_000766 [Paraburkholderia sp. JPY158]|uniref:Uncharacterized protein n=1 Tax=Paraburkholderia atlantica TaxID=2654982 RepID=A0A7W8Q3I5_PARAM|nr:hypothetical protein [Paraburkholderia atlantica]